MSLDIERDTLQLAQRVARRMRSFEPGVAERRFWADLGMTALLRFPRLKNEVFRLIDAISGMSDSQSIARHIVEYLSPVLPLPLRLPLQLLHFGPCADLAAWISTHSIRQLAQLFIAGESPEETLPCLQHLREQGLAFTVDLLGEYCLSEQEAEQYLDRYLACMQVFSREIPSTACAAPLLPGHPGEATPICLSVKLSALYSQAGILNDRESLRVFRRRLGQLFQKAREKNISLFIDAEDTGNNPLIYQVFAELVLSDEFRDFHLPGIVLQAYLRDSEERLWALLELAKRKGSPLAIRLVKGAYWDAESILAKQNDWLPPVFQHKSSSDAQYEKLSDILFQHDGLVLPAFASHNIRSLSYACARAAASGKSPLDFELQMLFGMADPIAQSFRDEGYLVRMYVPQGELLPGMGYLVRRLLENTSNESFLRHTFLSGDEFLKLLHKPHFAKEDLS